MKNDSSFISVFHQFSLISMVSIFISACDNPPPDNNGGGSVTNKPQPEVVPAQEAIQKPDIPTIDLMAMDQAEIDKVLMPGPRCRFTYTEEGGPVFAAGIPEQTAQGVVKIHGRLVELHADNIHDITTLIDGGVFAADSIRVDITPTEDESAKAADLPLHRPASLKFTLQQGLEVGYEGWYTCVQ